MTTIRNRRGTAEQWASANPILADGERGVETDTRKEKMGNGSTAWNSLPYFGANEIPANGVMAVRYTSAWPARPTSRTDVIVFWLGGTTQPSGMLTTDLWLPIAVSSGGGSGGGGGADTTAPTVPANLINTGSTASTLTFSWSSASDNIAVTGYEIRLNGGAATSLSGTSYQFTGLTSGTPYTATVRSRDAAGNFSAWSAGVTATPTASSDVTAPTTPTGLASSGITSSGFTVSWSAATDAVGVTGYEVRLNGGTAVTKTTLSHTFSGLTASTAYTATVRARDAAGNFSAWSSGLVITTSAGSGGGGGTTGVSIVDASGLSAILASSTPVHGTDLQNGSATVGAFYGLGGPWTLKGARYYVPDNFPDEAVTGSLIFRFHVLDFSGAGSPTSQFGTPSSVDAIGGRTVTVPLDGKGKWIDALLPTPLSMLTVNSSSPGNDSVMVSVQFSALTTRYVSWGTGRAALQGSKSVAAGNAEIPHTTGTAPVKIWAAESNFPGVAFYQPSSGIGIPAQSVWYGIDILAEV